MRVGTYMCVWFMHAFMSLHKHTDVHTHARTCALLSHMLIFVCVFFVCVCDLRVHGRPVVMFQQNPLSWDALPAPGMLFARWTV